MKDLFDYINIIKDEYENGSINDVQAMKKINIAIVNHYESEKEKAIERLEEITDNNIKRNL